MNAKVHMISFKHDKTNAYSVLFETGHAAQDWQIEELERFIKCLKEQRAAILL